LLENSRKASRAAQIASTGRMFETTGSRPNFKHVWNDKKCFQRQTISVSQLLQ